MTEREILASTYDSVCDIYELVKTKEGSITKSSWARSQENVPCALSVNKNAAPAQAEYNALNNLYTLFMSDLITVKAGSRILCNGFSLMCGEPFIYKGSHQEIPALMEKKA